MQGILKKEELKSILENLFNKKCVFQIEENCVYLHDNSLLEDDNFKEFHKTYKFKITKSLFDDTEKQV